MDYNLKHRYLLINKLSAIIRYDLLTDQEIKYENILSSDNGTKNLQITHDGQRVFLVDQGFLKEFEFSEDYQTLDLVKNYEVGQLWCMKMSNDGRFVWTGGYDHCLRKWSVDGGGLVKTVKQGHNSLIRLIRFTEDGKYLLTFQQNNSMRRICLETDEVIVAEGPQGPAVEGKYKCAALSYCGKMLVTSTDANVLQVWNTEDWSLAKDFGKICDNLSSIKITRDNRYLYAGGHLKMSVFNLRFLALDREFDGICTGTLHSMICVPSFE